MTTTRKKITGLAALGKKQRAHFKKLLQSQDLHTIDDVHKHVLVAIWLDGVDYENSNTPDIKPRKRKANPV